MIKQRFPEMRIFLAFFRKHLFYVVLGAACALVASLSAVGLMGLSGWFICAAALAGQTAATAVGFNFFFPSIGIRLLAITRTLSRYAERLVSHDAAFRMLETLRVWFYGRLEPIYPGRTVSFRSGDILNRLMADIDALDNLYVRVVVPTAVASLTAVAVFFFLTVYNFRIAFAGMIFMILSGFCLPVFAGQLGSGLGKNLAGRLADLRIRVVDGVRGLPVWLVFSSPEDLLDRVETENHAFLACQGRMSRLTGLTHALAILLQGAAVLAVLYLGLAGLENAELNGPCLVMVIFTIMAVFDSLMPLPAAFQYWGRTRESGRRLMEIADRPPEVIFPESSAAHPEGFEIVFQKVGFQYGPDDEKALEDVTFCLASGSRVAIVGETGSGKTTLVSLLARFWDPDTGRILVGGADIRQLSEKALRGIVSVVSQQTHIFSGTLRDNLIMADPEADEYRLLDALGAVGLVHWAENLPEGLLSWIGEGGVSVSTGQARRVALARAFLRNASVWVLDEPTEGLDSVTRYRVMENLLERSHGRTVLMVTHHLADLNRMDHVIVLERGRILDQGSPGSLSERAIQATSYRRRILQD